MTRHDFIKLVKNDQRAQWRQVFCFVSVIAGFCLLETFLAKKWEENLQLNQPYLWILIGIALIAVVVVIGVLRIGNKFLLKCRHCQKCLGGISSQTVIASGRCGFCGEQIIDKD